MMEIRKMESEEKAASACSGAIQEAIEASDSPTLLLLSGGSAFCVTHQLKLHAQNLTVGMGDERFDPDQSNFVLLKRDHGAFVSGIEEQGNTFLDTSPRFLNVTEAAGWYNERITQACTEIQSHNGKIIVLLGIGQDGHTAGILPFPTNKDAQFYELFLDTERMVVGYDATGMSKYTQRFTLTYPALLRASQLFVYAVGSEKQKTITAIQDPSLALHQCPAAFFTMTTQPVVVFTAE